MRKNNWIASLFILGAIVLLYPYLSQYMNQLIYQKEVQQFKSSAQLLPEREITETLTAAKECNDAIFNNEEELHDPFTMDYNRKQFDDCAGSPLDGEGIAAIEIPKLNLAIPVYLGATENELSKGVGQVEGSSLPTGGNNTHTVLAGHRGMGTKAMFRNLDEIQIGDAFTISTLEGTLEYVVYDTDIILPHETESLHIAEGKDLASLITCHPYRHNSHRLVIYGERIN